MFWLFGYIAVGVVLDQFLYHRAATLTGPACQRCQKLRLQARRVRESFERLPAARQVLLIGISALLWPLMVFQLPLLVGCWHRPR